MENPYPNHPAGSYEKPFQILVVNVLVICGLIRGVGFGRNPESN
jgi:hypothetical protein